MHLVGGSGAVVSTDVHSGFAGNVKRPQSSVMRACNRTSKVELFPRGPSVKKKKKIIAAQDGGDSAVFLHTAIIQHQVQCLTQKFWKEKERRKGKWLAERSFLPT